uniref:Calcium voltage-gated channel subunit alpha1 H n=1 Tax=Neovison vison TaxID=452646 RepID=A0A8C7BH88_NEOVI
FLGAEDGLGKREGAPVSGPGASPPESPEAERGAELGADEEQPVPYPALAATVFFCLGQTTRPRSWCLRLVCNPYPSRHVSMLVIMLNCVTLGMFRPCEDVECQSERCSILEAFDDFIFAFFAVEMIIKMVALGLFGQKCYLGDTWNRLDFFIVMAGYYSLDGHNVSLSAIRTVRVLRPLRAINRVPSMRILVTLLLDTLPMLGNVLLLCFFVFFIFGIVGVQLWAGLLRNRCFLDSTFARNNNLTFLRPYYQTEEGEENPFICSSRRDNGMQKCSHIPSRRELRVECTLGWEAYGQPQREGPAGAAHNACINWNQYYNVCRSGGSNPHNGAINFDNIGYAWIAIFQVGPGSVVEGPPGPGDTRLVRAGALPSPPSPGRGPPDAESVHSVYHADCHVEGPQERARVASAAHLCHRSSCAPGVPHRSPARLWPDPARALLPAGLGRAPSHLSGLSVPCPLPSPQAGTLTCELKDCPYCASALDDPDLEFSDSESGGSEGNAVYEFTQDVRHGDRRDPLRAPPAADLCRIVDSKYFNRGIMVAILTNTLSMGVEYHEQPDELTSALEISNIVFTSMFALEMLLKLLACGPLGYIHNPYNIFDGIIVVISVWEIVGQADGGLSVLRTFRLLRVLKLVRFLPALRRQLVVLMKTVDNVATFCMLLTLFIFIFSILGMHLFGCKFSLTTDTGDTVPDRKNFDSLLWAIVTVFQILTQEDWNVVLYNGMASTSSWAALYFVALMTFGNYVLFNLLVAILVEGFQAEVRGSGPCIPFLEALQGEHPLLLPEMKMYSLAVTPNGHPEGRGSLPPPLIMRTAATPMPTPKSSPHLDPAPGLLDSRRGSSSSVDPQLSDQKSLSSLRSSPCAHWGPNSAWSSRRSSWNSLGRAPSLKRRSQCGERESLLSGEGKGSTDEEAEDGRPGAGASPETRPVPLRRAESLDHRSSLDVRPPRPAALLPPKSQDCNGQVLALPGEFFLRIDSHKEDPTEFEDDVEDSCCLRLHKMLEPYKPAWCRSREPWALYLFSPQNRFRVTCQKIIAHKMFDHVVLVFIFLNCITIALERPDIDPGSTERVFLSVSNYIFTAIFVAEMMVKVPGLGGGKFYYCEGADTRNISTKAECWAAHYRWVRRKYNFDNLGQALMSLFVLSSKDGWVNIMYDGLDAVGIDQQPVPNHNPWMLLYFISFLLIVSFFVLNMFVGVVVENFHKCRQHQEAEEARRREEKRQRRLQRKRRSSQGLREAQRRPYYADYSPTRRSIHALCTSHYLDLFITFIIGVNVITMSMEHYNQPKSLDEALKYCNYVFTVVFVFEAALKLVAFGFRRFFKDRWNQLDLAIVLLSIMGITLEEIEMSAALPINPTIIRIMRVLRIARVLKLLKMATGMRALLDTVVQALPQVGNLGLLFMLLFFIYAALGVELFGRLECSEDNPCEGLSRHATFSNFGMAFLTLFRVSTGDNWNGIMKDTLRECAREDKHCLSYLPAISPIYFVTFVLVAQFVLVNVVVAVLMKHLEESNKEAREDAELDAEPDLEEAPGPPAGPPPAAPHNPDAPGLLVVPQSAASLGSTVTAFLAAGRVLPGLPHPIPPSLQEAMHTDSQEGHVDSPRDSGPGWGEPGGKTPVRQAPLGPSLRSPPRSPRPSSIRTRKHTFGQRCVSSRPLAPGGEEAETPDPADEEVSHITSSARSPSASPTARGGGGRDPDLCGLYGVDAQGFLEQPSQADEQRRASGEQGGGDGPPEARELKSRAPEAEPALGARRKKKMSPPCISVDPPVEDEGTARPPPAEGSSTTLRRRTPSCEVVLHRDSLEPMEGAGVDPGAKGERRAQAACRAEHLTVPNFAFEPLDAGGPGGGPFLDGGHNVAPEPRVSFSGATVPPEPHKTEPPVSSSDPPEKEWGLHLKVLQSPPKKAGSPPATPTPGDSVDRPV